MRHTLRVAIAAIVVASFVAACAKKNNSSGSDIAPPDNSTATPASHEPSPASFQAMEGPVTFGGYAQENGSPMTEDQLEDAVKDFPALGTGLALVRSASSASIAADGTITLSDAEGALVVVKADGEVVSSRAPFPVVAVGITSGAYGDGSGQGKEKSKQPGPCVTEIHFTLHAATAPRKESQQQKKEEAKANGLTTWVSMACPVPQPKQEQPKKEEPKKEEPKKEQPKKEEPKKEQPKTGKQS